MYREDEREYKFLFDLLSFQPGTDSTGTAAGESFATNKVIQEPSGIHISVRCECERNNNRER